MEPHLYTVVDKNTLEDMLNAFQGCIGIPIQVLDEKGTILLSYGGITKFCLLFKKYLPFGDSCERLHTNASKKAIDLGETYIFSCHANLNHIVFPLMNKDALWGSVLVGPFIMDKPDSTLVSDIAKRYNIPIEALLDMFDELGSLKVIEPEKVTHISKLLYYLFSNLINDSKLLLKSNQQKLLQQSRINESIQNYKFSEKAKNLYPLEKEKELTTKVKTGDIKAAKAILNDLLGYVLFSEGSSLEVIKTRAIELTALLSRAAIEGGAATDTILRLNNQFLKNLNLTTDIDSLCLQLQEIVVSFTESMFNYIPTKNYEQIKKAMEYIASNFSYQITLEDVAKHVNLNPSYFSTIFKQSSGSSFKEYLNMVRVEESKRLLSNTDYSIIDIAIAVGFEDQSYFSKVFKKYTGLTPKQYQ